MAEEIKPEVKTSLAKGFFSNPLSWLVMTITVGTFLFNLGGSTTSKKNDITGISKDQTAIRDEIKGLKNTLGTYGIKQDSLRGFVIQYAKKSDALQKSYVLWVQEHSKDIMELTHSLEGMTFEVVPQESGTEKSLDRPPAVIKYERVKPVKK